MGYTPQWAYEVRECDICRKDFQSTGDRRICLKCEREAVEKAKSAKLGSMESQSS